jgi:hypothetical protein
LKLHHLETVENVGTLVFEAEKASNLMSLRYDLVVS